MKDKLQPTGLNYYATVTDNFGSFLIPDVELNSNYAELMADGFYFNENWGRTSHSKLVLKAITDLSAQSDINLMPKPPFSTKKPFILIKYAENNPYIYRKC